MAENAGGPVWIGMKSCISPCSAASAITECVQGVEKPLNQSVKITICMPVCNFLYIYICKPNLQMFHDKILFGDAPAGWDSCAWMDVSNEKARVTYMTVLQCFI